MSVKRVQQEIDAAELKEWMAYYSLEPWGQERADLRAGIIASTVANSAPRGKGSKAFKASDFMPQYDSPKRKKKQTAKEMQAMLRLFTVAAGGTVNGKKGEA